MEKSRTHNFFGMEILRLTILLGTAGLVGILSIIFWNPEGLAQISSSTRINVPSVVSTPLIQSCPVGFSQFTEQQEGSEEATNLGCYNTLVDSRIDIDNQICSQSCEYLAAIGGNKDACLARCFINDRYTCRRTLWEITQTSGIPDIPLSCGIFAKPITGFNRTSRDPAAYQNVTYQYLCCGFYSNSIKSPPYSDGGQPAD